MEDSDWKLRSVTDNDVTDGFVVFGGGVIVGLVGFDKIGFENDRGQIAIDRLKD